ncbi:hypothetical protein PR202_ga26376 [Eleusine coracana subsp. coracana]|uniref:EF-hand domain-containing protein n=1 Tax=Eleusine coracana subsp. coracana TaxID=191504 RepID=A0AAV5DDY3_ELECO|nr:hypothetical protein PR202_ga26376 [Eleusine coracana subsp. coracana]
MAERGWFGRRKKKAQGEKVVVDGSEIRELVEDEEAFEMLVETKFRQLDAEGNGRLDVRELRPAVADIEAALGVPVEEASINTDHVYSEVVSELTHGTAQGEVSRAEFQEALHDILLGVAAGLKRDPIVILRMDGEDLKEFVDNGRYEPEAAAIFSRLGCGQDAALRQSLLAALQQLTVDHGMPPASDEWVVGNIIEPALLQLPADQLDQPASREGFFKQLEQLLCAIAERLKDHPVIVAHTENTFDGSGVKRLLANKFELDKLLTSVWKDVPAEHKKKASKECLRVAFTFDKMADAARLPPYGAVAKVDTVVDEAIKTANTDGGKAIDEAEFKRLLTDILGAVMLRLKGSPVFVSTNTVVHESLSSSSTVPASPSVIPMPSE